MLLTEGMSQEEEDLVFSQPSVVADKRRIYQIKWTQTSLMKAHTVSPEALGASVTGNACCTPRGGSAGSLLPLQSCAPQKKMDSHVYSWAYVPLTELGLGRCLVTRPPGWVSRAGSPYCPLSPPCLRHG